MSRARNIIAREDTDTLCAIVMPLTGGSANPNVIRAQAERIKAEEAAQPVTVPSRDADPAFDAWVASLAPKHWAKYDLAACRLGWDAALEIARRGDRFEPG